MSGLPAPAPIRYTDAVFDAALFVRSASPGAVLRFLERRKDAEKPAELLLSEAVGEEKWRALFAPPEYLSTIVGPLSVAFPPETLFAIRAEKTIMVHVYRGGALTDSKNSLEGNDRKWWPFPGFNALATPAPIWGWLREKEVPTQYMTKPPKNVIDYDTVAILDQRNLLVEDSPRLYRFPLC